MEALREEAKDGLQALADAVYALIGDGDLDDLPDDLYEEFNGDGELEMLMDAYEFVQEPCVNVYDLDFDLLIGYEFMKDFPGLDYDTFERGVDALQEYLEMLEA